MANRYWIGGTGTWDTSSTTNWSATSGGSGGASVPSTADDVFFDSASGAGTISLSGALNCKSITTTGSSFTFSSTGTLTIAGGITWSATTTWSASGTITFTSSGTITTNGVVLGCAVTFNGAASTWSLATALTLNPTYGTLTLTNGTVTTNNNSVTARRIVFATGTRTLNMGSSTFIILGTSTDIDSWDVVDPVNLTINSGTSSIYLTETYTGVSQQNFVGGGFTYYNLIYTGDQTSAISGNNTFTTIQNNIQPIVIQFAAGSTQTITNFNLTGTASSFVVIGSSIPGTQFNLVKSDTNNVIVLYCNISDSAASPGSTWYAPISVGYLIGTVNTDSGNNTGWNFTAQPQIYRISQLGNLYSSVAEFDEVTQITISMSKTAMYSAEFDEVSVISNAMSYTNTGIVQVLNELDEITVIISE